MKKFYILIIVVFIVNIANAQWQNTNFPYNGGAVYSIVTNGSNIYAGTDGGGFYLSNDNGVSWVAKNNGLTNLIIRSIAFSSNIIVVGTDDGVFVSSNYGTNWSQIVTGASVSSIAILGGNYIFIGASDGLFRCNLDGSGFFKVCNECKSSNVIYNVNNTLYTGIADIFGANYGIYKSIDGGLSRVSSNTGLSADTWVYDFATIGSTLYAATSNGIYTSSNNGGNWNKIASSDNALFSFIKSLVSNLIVIFDDGIYNFIGLYDGVGYWNIMQGFANSPIVTSFNLNNTYAYVGLLNGNIWKRPLTEIATVGIEDSPLQNGVSTNPNPVKDKLLLRINKNFDIQNATFSIYNIQGQLVCSQNLNQYEIDINVSFLSKGFYFLKVNTKKGVGINKFTKE